jgi:hypothetical protein
MEDMEVEDMEIDEGAGAAAVRPSDGTAPPRRDITPPLPESALAGGDVEMEERPDDGNQGAGGGAGRGKASGTSGQHVAAGFMRLRRARLVKGWTAHSKGGFNGDSKSTTTTTTTGGGPAWANPAGPGGAGGGGAAAAPGVIQDEHGNSRGPAWFYTGVDTFSGETVGGGGGGGLERSLPRCECGRPMPAACGRLPALRVMVTHTGRADGRCDTAGVGVGVGVGTVTAKGTTSTPISAWARNERRGGFMLNAGAQKVGVGQSRVVCAADGIPVARTCPRPWSYRAAGSHIAPWQ